MEDVVWIKLEVGVVSAKGIKVVNLLKPISVNYLVIVDVNGVPTVVVDGVNRDVDDFPDVNVNRTVYGDGSGYVPMENVFY